MFVYFIAVLQAGRYLTLGSLYAILEVYSEPLFCSLGVAPFVTAIVVGVMSLVGAVFVTLFVEKVFLLTD